MSALLGSASKTYFKTTLIAEKTLFALDFFFSKGSAVYLPADPNIYCTLRVHCTLAIKLMAAATARNPLNPCGLVPLIRLDQ